MVEIATPHEMFELGKRIGAQLRAGDLILLSGPLGAGKTLLTQGIGASLGIEDITSPTFVISRTHKAPDNEIHTLIHVDAYRLLQSENPNLSLDDLDLDTEREDAVTVVEWGGIAAARLSDERLEITIDRRAETRKVSSVAIGARWEGFRL
jgi:tRNA threonylcarbamoyladenosine biosynthesis protein TsaE